MFELIVRVVLASGAMAAAGILGRPDFDLAWKTALLFAAYSYLLYMMEQKGARNSGVAGLAAVADGGVVAVLLADVGLVPQIGFLSAVPMVYAFWRFRSNAAMMSPLVASWLLVGANLFGGGNGFTPSLLVQSLAVLVLGVTLSQVRAARENRLEIAAAAPDNTLEALLEQASEPQEIAQDEETANQEHLELRESYRQLADSARELERRGRSDRACVQYFETAARNGRSPFNALAAKIQDVTGAEGVCLYTVSQTGDALIVRSATGNADHAATEVGIEIPRRASEGEVSNHLEASIRAVRDPASRTKFANVLLKLRGKIVGMLSLFHANNIELEATVRRANESAEFLAELVSDLIARDETRRKLSEAEMLYSVATTTLGATTAGSLASRVVRDLAQATGLEHVSAYSVRPDGSTELLALEGQAHQFLEHVKFGSEPGARGWVEAGAPLVHMANARNDDRVDSKEAIKLRIGGVLLVPLEFGAKPFGFLLATSPRPNGIDSGEVETVRAVCAELSQALARLDSGSHGPEGLATPREFFSLVQGASGHLVYLEVPQKEELAESYGRPALEHAVRRLAVRLKSELPPKSAMTRRSEGDYVAFLATEDEEFARRWANEATALASMVALRTPDGRTRIPLALRAKVAPVNQQIHRISTGRVA